MYICRNCIPSTSTYICTYVVPQCRQLIGLELGIIEQLKYYVDIIYGNQSKNKDLTLEKQIITEIFCKH